MGTAKITNVTFAQNSAGDQGDSVYTAAGPLLLRNSILPGLMGFLDPCAGNSVSSAGFNVASQNDADCEFIASDVTDAPGNQGVKLPPSDNGGLTDTIALKKSSPAVDLVPKKKCKPAKHEDQRGYRRPAGKRWDAGAYERGAKP